MSEVTNLIAAYRRGQLTFEELTQRFREREWPTGRPHARSLDELYQRELEDPEPLLEGSFDEVILAYDRGEISGDEYHVLAQAVAEANPRERRE